MANSDNIQTVIMQAAILAAIEVVKSDEGGRPKQ